MRPILPPPLIVQPKRAAHVEAAMRGAQRGAPSPPVQTKPVATPRSPRPIQALPAQPAARRPAPHVEAALRSAQRGAPSPPVQAKPVTTARSPRSIQALPSSTAARLPAPHVQSAVAQAAKAPGHGSPPGGPSVAQPSLGWGAIGLGAGLIAGGIATGGIGYLALGLGSAGALVGHYGSEAWRRRRGGGAPPAAAPAPGPYVPFGPAQATDPVSVGGRHGDVKQHSGKFVRESNHVPPKDVYHGTPYAWVPENNMPAHSLPYRDHRTPRGRVGGAATSTGSSHVSRGYRTVLRNYMGAGEFWKAMMIDINDILNTHELNRDWHIPGLLQAAQYARDYGLITNNDELNDVNFVIFNGLRGVSGRVTFQFGT